MEQPGKREEAAGKEGSEGETEEVRGLEANKNETVTVTRQEGRQAVPGDERLQSLYGHYRSLLAGADSDPVEQPYRSRYLALHTLAELETAAGQSERGPAVRAHLAAQASVLRVEVEEPAEAERLAKEALALCVVATELEGAAGVGTVLAARLAACNQLGIIAFNRDKLETARESLEASLAAHNAWAVQQPASLAWSLQQLLCGGESVDPQPGLELLLTHTEYYLAQVHGKLGNSKKSAEFCHRTLARQLKLPAHLDPLDWAANAATLSQFYINQSNYRAAHYHLAAARAVLDGERLGGVRELQEEQRMGEEVEKEAGTEEEQEKDAGCRAHVARLCGKYGLSLLEHSRAEPGVLSKVYQAIEDIENPEAEAVECPEFEGLELQSKLGEVTAAVIADWETARRTFLWAQTQFTASQKFYLLEERCSDHVEIVRDLSQLYKHLIGFETEPERASKMHRRRADLLEPILDQLSETHYLLTIRQILFELGEIFSDLMELKTARWSAEPGNPQHARKVNLMVTTAIRYFTRFLDTMAVEGKQPEKYNDDSVRPALLARFHLGRLASKLVVEAGSEQQLRNSLTSLARYKEQSSNIAAMKNRIV